MYRASFGLNSKANGLAGPNVIALMQAVQSQVRVVQGRARKSAVDISRAAQHRREHAFQAFTESAQVTTTDDSPCAFLCSTDSCVFLACSPCSCVVGLCRFQQQALASAARCRSCVYEGLAETLQVSGLHCTATARPRYCICVPPLAVCLEKELMRSTGAVGHRFATRGRALQFVAATGKLCFSSSALLSSPLVAFLCRGDFYQQNTVFRLQRAQRSDDLIDRALSLQVGSRASIALCQLSPVVYQA